jgi:hypothetical protein
MFPLMAAGLLDGFPTIRRALAPNNHAAASCRSSFPYFQVVGADEFRYIVPVALGLDANVPVEVSTSASL